MTMLKNLPFRSAILLTILVALAASILAFLQYNQANKSRIGSGALRFNEKLFLQQIEAHKKNIEACERARGNWPRRYGSDRFCESNYPYPLTRPNKTLSAEYIRSLSKR